jgi:hypothetical protein
MKNKETLEEVAANLFWTVGNEGIADIDSFIKGAKLQAERMYSEEDMQEYAEFCVQCFIKNLPCIIAKDWFEQFKKD